MTLPETNFFENVNHQLTVERYYLLHQNFSQINCDTFFDIANEEHINEIRKVYRKMNLSLEKSYLNSDLLSFYWTFADLIYHSKIYDKFDNELSEAKGILKGNKFESEEKELLLQKIEQHYSL
ncbi:MAG: hypothetical protein V4548_07655 [Bacteroidota bacterium]